MGWIKFIFKSIFTVQTLSLSRFTLWLFNITQLFPASPTGCPYLSTPIPPKLPTDGGPKSHLLIFSCSSSLSQIPVFFCSYVLGALYQLVNAAWLVVQYLTDPGDLVSWDWWFSYRFTLLVSLVQLFPPASVHWLGVNICIRLFQLLVEQSW
jgi:hypothetical protein